jgi:glycosyltransferase involved in cell wall biosynthesis
MIVGFDAPLPPARTGVADYAAALLAALRRFGTIEVNPSHADVRLYHLGNNQLHRETYLRALAQPGVVVLHDAVLQHFFLGCLNEQEYADEFVYNYGEWCRTLASELWRERASSGSNQRYYEYPMLRRIAEVSRAIVVHNPAAARMVREHAPRARVIEIPHLFLSPALPAGADILRFRQRLGLSTNTFVFGVFGYLRESKRIMNVLRAFNEVHRALSHTALLIAGDFVSSDLARAVGPFLTGPGIRRIGYLPEREFWVAASAIDACINLRYPAAGETSGISVRLMGIAKPVMMTAGEEISRYPETACFRITPGVAEKRSLMEHIVVAAVSPQTSRELGSRGAGHIRSFHSLDRVAEQYWETLCACGR